MLSCKFFSRFLVLHLIVDSIVYFSWIKMIFRYFGGTDLCFFCIWVYVFVFGPERIYFLVRCTVAYDSHVNAALWIIFCFYFRGFLDWWRFELGWIWLWVIVEFSICLVIFRYSHHELHLSWILNENYWYPLLGEDVWSY